MKAFLLLLLSVLGVCNGKVRPRRRYLQTGYEYQYRYRGRVASGITDVRQQFSAAGIQADVTVQLEEESIAIFKFSNVEVGDFHGDFTCDMHLPLPIEYHPLQEGVELLEKPFKVTINGSQVFESFEVPQEEPAWISNIRKSIVNIFRITPFDVKEEFEYRIPHAFNPDFALREQTVAGICTNWYSVIKLSEMEALKEDYERNQIIEEDAQREDPCSNTGGTGTKGRGTKGAKGAKGSKGRKGAKGAHKGGTKTGRTSPHICASAVPPIEDTLWHVIRTLDIEDCDNTVSMKSHINCGTEDLISRTSVGNYLIRGGEFAMRIEKAVIEGSITVFTENKEHYDTFTNQTLELKAVRSIEVPLTIDYAETSTFYAWYYEVAYDLLNQKQQQQQHSQRTLEQILTGVELTEDAMNEIKGIVNTAIEDLSAHLPRNPTHHNDLVGEISHVVDAVSVLNYQQLEELYNQYVSENSDPRQFNNMKLYILKQAMISAGTDQTINFLLHKMTEVDFRRQYGETVYKFFSNIDTTIKSRSYITKIMDTIMQITWDSNEIGEKSVALMTFSKLITKMCMLSSEDRCNFWDLPCRQDHICPTDSIINTYIPYLQQGLEDLSTPSWHRLIYLQALTLLGTPHTINILQPYIIGSKATNTAFRKNAIWSLNKLNMPDTAMGKVFDLLMPVFENVAEYHEIRNMAFITMASWESSTSFWYKMAVSTWHEPSRKVASFITTTIKTTARIHGNSEMSKAASRVEHLAKPAAPSSITHSINYYVLEMILSTKLGRPLNFAWFASTGEDALIPSHVYFKLKTSTFLGFTHDVLVSFQHYGGDALLMKYLQYWYSLQTKKPVDEANVETVMEMFNELKEHIEFESTSEHSEQAIFLMVDLVYRAIFLGRDQHFYMESWMYGNQILGMPQYNRYVDAYVAIPTELGVPFIAKHTAQYAWWVSHDHGTATATLDASNMFTVETKTLIPWSKKFAMGTGSENLISILLPITINIRPNMRLQEVEIEISPATNDKVNLIDAHNLPFTVQYGAFPTIVHYNDNECKTIKEADDYLYTRKTQALPSFLGLSIESEWTGDIQFPFNLRSLYKGEFSLFTPSLKTWDYHILYNPEISTTKTISTVFTYVSTTTTSGATAQGPGQGATDYADYTQFGQSSSSDYSQFGQSSSSDYSQFGQSSSGDVDVFAEAQSETMQRITRLQQQVLPATGGFVRSISIDFNLRGEPNKKYAAVLHWVRGTTSSKRSTKFMFSWMKDVPQGTFDVPHTTCLNVELIKPLILPFASAEEVLNTNFHATIKADVYDGENCDQSSVLKIQGTMDVSQDQLNDARKKLTEEHCGPTPELEPIDVITSPIYDHINFKAQWTEEFPIELKNFTYFIYDMSRGYLFPDNDYDYTVTNPDHHVEIDATKDIKTHLWTSHITKPTEVSIVENIQMFYFFDVIASPAFVRETLLFDFVNGHQHEACVIDHHKIRTFDGLEIQYEPDSCWNVLVMDTTEHNYKSIEVRYIDDEWEARILMPAQGLFLELTRSSLRVNGEDFSGHHDYFSYINAADGIILTLPFLSNAVLKISDKIYYLEDQMFRSWQGGLCGNLDGEITAEMVGPKGCVYTDPELFINSWKTPGQGCRGFTFRGMRRSVEEYQETCIKKSNVPTGVLYPDLLNDCYEWEHHERTEDNYICKSVMATPKCKSGCHGVRPLTNSFQYDCILVDGQGTSADHECYTPMFDITFPGKCVYD